MIFNVIVLGLASAINPTMVTAVGIILTRPRAKSGLIAFLAGGLLVSVGAGIAAILILQGASIGKGNGGAKIGPGVELFVGVLFLLTAVFLPRMLPRVEATREHRKERKEAKKGDDGPGRLERLLQNSSPGMAFLIGVAFNLPGGCYVVCLAQLADHGASVAGGVAAILLFNVIMFLPAEVPLVLYLRDPTTTQARIDAARVWMRTHEITAIRSMFAIMGTYLVARGALQR